MSKLCNTFICIIHSETNSSSTIKLINLHFLLCSIISFECYLKCTRLIYNEICSFVLISEGMSTNNDRLCPSRNQSWNIFDDNRLSEDCSIKNVSNSSIRTFPHFFKFELFNSSLVRCNCGTFDSNFALFNGFSSLNSNDIIGGISILNS